MLAHQFIGKNPWRDDSQNQKRIENNYYCHNKRNLFEDAKL